MREDHFRRADNRRRTEEVMGWFCVPVILILGWLGFQAWEEAVAARQTPAAQQAVTPARVVQPR
ncbi:MAG: hypothetical protein ACRC7C_01735 [Beijerinckiaceae bacterium]